MAARTQASTPATAPEITEHGFDVDAFEARVRTELSRRGVPLGRDEGTYLAKLFMRRARKRGLQDSFDENLMGHPIWVHIAAVHDAQRQSRVVECEVCGLLWTLWLLYVRKHDKLQKQRAQSNKRRLALAKASRRVAKPLVALKQLLAADFETDDEFELLRLIGHFERKLDMHTTLPPELQKEGRQGARRGRHPKSLLREIEQALQPCFRDKPVATFVFGEATASTLRSMQDRRRPAGTKRRRSEK
jgi:hypothetical protein